MPPRRRISKKRKEMLLHQIEDNSVLVMGNLPGEPQGVSASRDASGVIANSLNAVAVGVTKTGDQWSESLSVSANTLPSHNIATATPDSEPPPPTSNDSALSPPAPEPATVYLTPTPVAASFQPQSATASLQSSPAIIPPANVPTTSTPSRGSRFNAQRSTARGRPYQRCWISSRRSPSPFPDIFKNLKFIMSIEDHNDYLILRCFYE